MKTFLSIAFVFSLISCASELTKKEPIMLENSRWNLVLMAGENLVEKSDLNLFFQKGRVSGLSGCNRFFGQYAVGADFIELSKIGSTRRACIRKNLMAQESNYLTMLENITNWKIKGEHLILTGADDKKLIFKRIK